MSLLGHFWTVAPRLRHGLRPMASPPARPWRAALDDPRAGRIHVTGLWRELPGAEAAVVLVHGLGGCTGSHYMLRGAAAAEAAGLSCLRLNLRGCDRAGEDFYHAGLTADLHAALAAPELLPYRRIFTIGYSLGGHVALRLATEEGDPRLAAVAAVCAPLNLSLSVREIDAPARWVYRRYLMGNLNGIYAAVAGRRPELAPIPAAAARRIATLREWDDRIVAPRHGFRDAGDYYERAGVASRLGALRVPALLLNSERDPMVPPGPVRAVVATGAPRLQACWVPGGGHCAFPRSLDAGFGGGAGLDVQLLAWLQRQG
jgi:uncharacterized protein